MSTNRGSTGPFRLMDLPKELRLIVYENIPITTKHETLACRYHRRMPSEFATYTLVVRSIETSILATCHHIHNEAVSVIQIKLRRILMHPAMMIVDRTSLDTLSAHLNGPLYVLYDYHRFKMERPNEEYPFGEKEERIKDYAKWHPTHRRYYPSATTNPLFRRWIRRSHLQMMKHDPFKGTNAAGRFHTLEVAVHDGDGDRACIPFKEWAYLSELSSLFWDRPCLLPQIRLIKHTFPEVDAVDERWISLSGNSKERMNYYPGHPNAQARPIRGDHVLEPEWGECWEEGDRL
ncbi:hypothetical protein BCR34DRAFT_206652 [Clohesyomyces aquaticus]|uniref:F-box domain-containing protein n=1 Tax=Clohesyomyces aquaticus TaxID=1231657 RepID=A0A1Y2AAV5_9PLEO|nr:hypothetical protein BCR34DRAFT_206652 [Clohesyomyces aquaticus]